MRDEVWFKHDARSRLDPKMSAFIRDAGAEGYGFFWAVIEVLHYQREHSIELETELYGICGAIGMTIERANELVVMAQKRHLFRVQDGVLWQERMKRDQGSRRVGFEASKASMSDGGRLGGIISGLKRRGAKSEEIQTVIEGYRRGASRVEGSNLDKREERDKILDRSKDLSSSPEKAKKASPPLKSFAPKISMNEDGYSSLVSEFGEESFRHYLPICSDWLQHNGRNSKNSAAFMRNWIRKDIAERKGFYYPKQNQLGFKPHTAATTVERNLDYMRKVENGEIDPEKEFNIAFDRKEKPLAIG